MRWRVDRTKLVRDVVWIGLVVAIAAYGSAIVRNVTDTLVGMTAHPPSMVVVARPSR